MRPREEIEKDIIKYSGHENVVTTIEVLLDIRELLNDLINKGTIWTEKKEP